MKKKINVTGLVLLIIGIIVCVLSFIFSTQLFSEASIFNNNPVGHEAIDTLYHKIPAIVRSIEIITMGYVIYIVLKFVFTKLFSKNKRSLTIIKLLASFVKYAIAIVAILLILSAFGVDGRTLLASAGILGLVIGLGAQSLIADIIAGVFIVFEGDFEVGDIVVVDNWRGEVQEIGIRTTKIIDWGGNVKIVNNSHIASIVNQTKQLSIAVAYIGIEYGKPIPEVEKVIMDNLDRIKANVPEIIEGPFYKGVDELAASSVNLLFMAKCKEEDLYIVKRALNRELKMMFDENGINVPFPQITISKLEEKKNQDFTSNREVENFVKEQRELSKDLEEKN
ncbi:MAG: mechanosensitive ion channel family protein [Bacilli bacterium]|nr:mechanosensitive ion channel family protein [Bacilli bacterium]